MLLDKPIVSLPPTELRRVYDVLEIDALKQVVAIVGFIKKYESMTIEELRKEYKESKSNKELIKQMGLWKKQQS